MSIDDPILHVQDLTKIYPPRRKDIRSLRDVWDKITGKESGKPVTALKDLTLSVKRQEIFGLVGPNGAGKTTLCKILNALVLPTSGWARIDGYDVISQHGDICRRVFPLFGGESDMWGGNSHTFVCSAESKRVASILLDVIAEIVQARRYLRGHTHVISG